jgi:hypothetical protein
VKCYIDNSVRSWSCIRNINKHFWRRCLGGCQYSLSVYRLHRIVLVSFISLIELSVALCLFMVFTGKCVTEFDLPTNYHLDPKSLLRKYCSRLSTPGSSGSCVRDIIDQFQGSTPQVELVPLAARKWINDLSISSSANIRTGPKTNIGDGNFELKSALINMVQSPRPGYLMECWPSRYLHDRILHGKDCFHQGVLIRRQSYPSDYACTLGRAAMLDGNWKDSCTRVPAAGHAWSLWPCLVMLDGKCAASRDAGAW